MTLQQPQNYSPSFFRGSFIMYAFLWWSCSCFYNFQARLGTGGSYKADPTAVSKGTRAVRVLFFFLNFPYSSIHVHAHVIRNQKASQKGGISKGTREIGATFLQAAFVFPTTFK